MTENVQIVVDPVYIIPNKIRTMIIRAVSDTEGYYLVLRLGVLA
jgi:hypothetical protein